MAMKIIFEHITDLTGGQWIGVQDQGEGTIAVSLGTKKERQAFARGAKLVADMAFCENVKIAKVL
jgi:hypothetical protein